MSESFVWKYFVKDLKQEFATCNECKTQIKCKGLSTSSLIRHLSNKHNIDKLSVTSTKRTAEETGATSSKRLASQQTLPSLFIKKETCEEIVTKLAILDGISINPITKSELFRKSLTDKGYTLPKNPSQVMDLIHSHYKQIKQRLCSEIDSQTNAGSRFSLSLDECTSLNNLRYLNVNIHKSDGTFWNLGMVKISNVLPAETAVQVIKEKLNEFHICLEKHVVACVTDGAAVMVKFGRLIESVCDVLYQRSTISVAVPLSEEIQTEEEECNDNIEEDEEDFSYSIDLESVLLPQDCRGDCGCFPLDYPFAFDFDHRPFTPSSYCSDANFYLYTPQNRNNANIINSFEVSDVKNSNFDPSKSSYFIVHGWFGNGSLVWVQTLKNKLLDYENCNVIVMNWGKAAKDVNYMNASANTRMCGSFLALFIQLLQKIYCITLKSVFLIGFSLGAHLCGYAGKRLGGELGGILAGHLKLAFGHITFHVNGGRKQPGCRIMSNRKKRSEITKESLQAEVYCNHNRAFLLLIDSFDNKDCPFYGYECDSYENFQGGKCNRACNRGNPYCFSLGIEILRTKLRSKSSVINLFMQTAPASPYCHTHYYVRVICNSDIHKIWMYGRNTDELLVKLHGSLRTTDYIIAYKLGIKYNSKPYVEFLISFRNLGDIRKITLLLKKKNEDKLINRVMGIEDSCQNYTRINSCEVTSTVNNYCERCPYYVMEINVLNLETGTKTTFKGKNKPLKLGFPSTFNAISIEESVEYIDSTVTQFPNCKIVKN
ncbi:pancreatic lipase-related protein 2-like [Centruroides vittatus]|uniref:pancreatic lipase-related protein 2-like n=1 Tax=Centruroides vittatus TaxID=120091 RepID=UPI00350FEEE4